MQSAEPKQRRPFRLIGYLLFLIAAFALFDFLITNQCSICGCTRQSRLKSLLSNSKKKQHSKSVKPLFVPPTTTGSKPATEDDQESTLDEKIPLFLDYPTPAVPYKVH